PQVDVHMLPEELRTTGPNVVSLGNTGHRELWMIERAAIEQAIGECDGSVPQAAKRLGVSPSTLYRKREAWLGKSLET
ncbi:MAG: helix-turn-helix domain-containing protein, partial [Pseudomonadota bacterium]